MLQCKSLYFQGFPKLISEDWGGVPRVDACLTFLSEYTQNALDSGEITYLFWQGNYQVFKNMKAVGEAKNITLNWGLPQTPNAAFQGIKNSFVYFTIGDLPTIAINIMLEH